MDAFPANLRYSPTHEWVRVDDENTVTIGITEHAQGLLGDLVFVELPVLNRQVSSGEELAVVESVKAASDVYSPLTGSVISVNNTLQGAPGTVNSDPYGAGWLFRLQITDQSELDKLLNAEKYKTLIEDGE